MIAQYDVDRMDDSKPAIYLDSPAGNAFALMAQAEKTAKDLDIKDVSDILSEMTSSDYETLLETFNKYFGDYIDLVRESH